MAILVELTKSGGLKNLCWMSAHSAGGLKPSQRHVCSSRVVRSPRFNFLNVHHGRPVGEYLEFRPHSSQRPFFLLFVPSTPDYTAPPHTPPTNTTPPHHAMMDPPADGRTPSRRHAARHGHRTAAGGGCGARGRGARRPPPRTTAARRWCLARARHRQPRVWMRLWRGRMGVGGGAGATPPPSRVTLTPLYPRAPSPTSSA